MLAPLVRLALEGLAPAGAASRLTVLIFHRVLAEHDPLQPDLLTAQEFRARLIWLKKHFNVVSLGEGVRGLREQSLPARPVVLTFDDGYADNHDVALPVLTSLGLTATFFVSTGYLDGGVMFNDLVIEGIRQAPGPSLDLTSFGLRLLPVATLPERIHAIQTILPHLKSMPLASRNEVAAQIALKCGAELPRHLMMSRAKVAAMRAAGMEVGAHTVSHPILSRTTPDRAHAEIKESREVLEEVTGSKISLFAYPNGRPGIDYLAEHVSIVRDLGFDGAVSTARGVATCGSDPFQIPRFTPWDAVPWRFGLRLAMNLQSTEFETV